MTLMAEQAESAEFTDDNTPISPSPSPITEKIGKNLSVITFGCRLNFFESEVIKGLAIDKEPDAPPMIVINSCAVTAEAERQLRQAIRKARRTHPGAKIIVTGCAAQIDPEKYAAMPEIDRVIGNLEKFLPASYQNWSLAPLLAPLLAPQKDDKLADGMNAKKMVADIMQVREHTPHLIDGFDGRARAFIEVQQGCDHRCSFCIIPFGRGNNRSVALGPIITQIRHLVARGCQEIVLTGVDLASWGADLPGYGQGVPRLGDMVRRILRLVPELPRLRLSSLDPAAIDEEMWRILAEEPRLMPHLHLSIQSGHDLILKRMKRRHLSAQVVEVVARARAARPDIAIGGDFIAGFPTESEEHAAATRDLIGQCGINFLHVFPYSPRPGTPAARMPQLPPALIAARAARLRDLAATMRDDFLQSRQGKSEEILWESENFGHTQHFADFSLAAGTNRRGITGTLGRVVVTGQADGKLIGHIS
ncbi:MAG: tRNA (N(6)-L-threonylcarbamoyladenosine(37)-C(2))-methylthiotransferase MtaB [Candidatus Symbiobacter sp.]|nr:tRNA (N(6)-L-threonylcarbamoyladenosine(37)-C(2))-methylthiotransferase MtaB [Candidatus Symbiobacter sp.]